jgi:hypothetical protein
VAEDALSELEPAKPAVEAEAAPLDPAAYSRAGERAYAAKAFHRATAAYTAGLALGGLDGRQRAQLEAGLGASGPGWGGALKRPRCFPQ